MDTTNIGKRNGENAAFGGQAEATRRALVEFPDRIAAFCGAWEKELGHNANYPDAPGEAGGGTGYNKEEENLPANWPEGFGEARDGGGR